MDLTIVIEKPGQRAALFGPADGHLRLIRSALDVRIAARDSAIHLSGAADSVAKAAAVIENLQQRIRSGEFINADQVAAAIEAVARRRDTGEAGTIEVYTGQAVAPHTPGQAEYVEAIFKSDLTFGVGPAGTGKTYLAVAVAVSLLKRNQIKRIVLVRPAVEAGEKLGFLPGDLQAKVNPYLRPLFDAMHDMMGFDQIRRFMQNDIIEVIPLAFMRGRTLNHAAVILDEAQNSTVSQMLMFLTRMGQESKMIVTGDDSQIDLAPGQPSGMIDGLRRLQGIPGVAIVRLKQTDIVRHKLVQHIVEAYGNHQKT
ncbi:MAG TPA: PhoH family protein [Phycisphaerae bacterium]